MRKYWHITAVLKNGTAISGTNFPANSKKEAYLDFIERNPRDIENVISITIIERVDEEF
jgi:hypothetical protein